MNIKIRVVLFALCTFLFFQNCKNDDNDMNPSLDLASEIEGIFTGTLKRGPNIISETYQVKLAKKSSNSVILTSDDCTEIEIILSGNINEGIFGQADTINNFNYLVEDEKLQFLVNNSNVFKTYEGIKN